MPEPKKHGSIEISQDMEFQRRSWKVQRAGWIVMLLVAIAGLAGFFGDGPVATATVGEGSAAEIRYRRFARLRALTQLEARLEPASERDTVVALWVGRNWLDSHTIVAVDPTPIAERSSGDGVVYFFGVVPGSRAMTVRFELRPRRAGAISGRAGPQGREAHRFSEFVFP